MQYECAEFARSLAYGTNALTLLPLFHLHAKVLDEY
jgi:hypothetical protein